MGRSETEAGRSDPVMMHWQKFLVAAAALTLAGCVPMKFSGYRASGDGSPEGGYCVAWIKDRLRVHAPSGVDLLLYTMEHGYSDAVVLNVDLTVPEGVAAQWESPKLLLRSPEWPRPRSWVIERIRAGRSYLDPAAVLTGSSRRSMGTYSLAFVSTDEGTLAEPRIPRVRSFTVALPILRINGRAFQAGPVAFEAYRDWGMFTCVQ